MINIKFENFQKHCGLKINMKKTKAIHIGTDKFKNLKLPKAINIIKSIRAALKYLEYGSLLALGYQSIKLQYNVENNRYRQ